MANSRYNALFIFEIPKINLGGELDHGFADISNFSEYHNEKEVLFNALNIFKIVSKRMFLKPIYHMGVKEEKLINVIRMEYGGLNTLKYKRNLNKT